MLKPFVNRTTKWLAELSYGVYLIHWLIVIYLYEFAGLPSNGTLGDLAAVDGDRAAAVAPVRGALATLVRAADPALGAAPDGRPAADREVVTPAGGPGSAVGSEPAVIARSE